MACCSLDKKTEKIEEAINLTKQMDKKMQKMYSRYKINTVNTDFRAHKTIPPHNK